MPNGPEIWALVHSISGMSGEQTASSTSPTLGREPGCVQDTWLILGIFGWQVRDYTRVAYVQVRKPSILSHWAQVKMSNVIEIWQRVCSFLKAKESAKRDVQSGYF